MTVYFRIPNLPGMHDHRSLPNRQTYSFQANRYAGRDPLVGCVRLLCEDYFPMSIVYEIHVSIIDQQAMFVIDGITAYRIGSSASE